MTVLSYGHLCPYESLFPATSEAGFGTASSRQVLLEAQNPLPSYPSIRVLRKVMFDSSRFALASCDTPAPER